MQRHFTCSGLDCYRQCLRDLLAERGHVDEAVAALRTRADSGDANALERLVDIQTKHGRGEEAMCCFLRRRTTA
jgi:hypothetical protein